MKNEKIYLPIGANYVKHWGLWEAVRELLQNAIDTDDFKVKKSELSNNMIIASKGGKLDVSSLMLGESTKQNDDSKIGKYGEGYKLAMLVLCRAGYDIKVSNGQDLWSISIDEHPQLKADCLCISIETDHFEEDRENEVCFVINGLTENDFIEIKEKFIDKESLDSTSVIAQNDGSTCFEYQYSNIRKVFVGGLYVCDLPHDENYWYSYDFAPNVLELDRDRSAVDSFMMQLHASSLIESSGSIELLLDMANDEACDISGYHEPVTHHYGYSSGYSHQDGGYTVDQLEDIALKGFIKANGENAYPIKHDIYGEEKKAIIQTAISLGLNPVTVKKSVYKYLPQKTKDALNIVSLKGKTSDALAEFLKENKKHMRSKARKNLTSIINSIRIKGQ